MTFRLTPAAERDLQEIADHIAQENPPAADRLIDRFETTFRRLSEFPYLGVARHDARHGMRVLPVGRYLILYSISGDFVDRSGGAWRARLGRFRLITTDHRGARSPA